MALLRGLWSRTASRLAIEAAVMVAAYWAYEAVRLYVTPSSREALERALNLIRFEQRLGIFFEPNLQRLIVDHDWLVTLFNGIYVWGYLPVIGAAALYLFIFHRAFYTRYRNAFLLSGAVGLVVFATLPVAPPRMFPEFGFVDTVQARSSVYSTFENSGFVNQFAAVPSFHFGWILLVGIALFQTTRRVLPRIAGVAMPVVMLLAIVLTANHYVIDAVAGGVIVLGALGVVLALERWSQRHPLRLHQGAS